MYIQYSEIDLIIDSGSPIQRNRYLPTVWLQIRQYKSTALQTCRFIFVWGYLTFQMSLTTRLWINTLKHIKQSPLEGKQQQVIDTQLPTFAVHLTPIQNCFITYYRFRLHHWVLAQCSYSDLPKRKRESNDDCPNQCESCSGRASSFGMLNRYIPINNCRYLTMLGLIKVLGICECRL